MPVRERRRRRRRSSRDRRNKKWAVYGLAALLIILLTGAVWGAVRSWVPASTSPGGSQGQYEGGKSQEDPSQENPDDSSDSEPLAAAWPMSRMQERYEERLSWKRDNIRPVKGIYVPAGPASISEWFGRLVRLVETTELNAMVIDIKESEGIVLYDSQIEAVRSMDASRPYIRDLPVMLDDLRSRGIYTIARIVVFKDSLLAREHPEWAIQNSKTGTTWRDRTGAAWLDPNNRNVWEYNLELAKEAVRAGFDEIQFDYVRFPSDGDVAAAVYPSSAGLSRERVIRDFLHYARGQLAEYGVPLSADVFGLVPTVTDGMSIGQRWEEVVSAVDFISPMAYPSHYALGTFGLGDPDAAPYETVYNTMVDAQERTRLLDASIRPWLQDFSLRHTYGPAEVRAQIRAAEETGASGWLLWSPRAEYTEGALRAP